MNTSRMACSLLVIASLLAGACAPDRIVIDLAPGDGQLQETSVLQDSQASGSAPKIAMIDVVGLIASVSVGVFPSSGNPVDDLVVRLNKAGDDASVKGVVIRVNSPGGTVAASEMMYREIRAFRERTGKPVVVSMSEVATSGGYYIALAGDRVIAQETSVTGSIGVLFQTFNFSDGMRRVGIESRAVVSRPNKDLASPFEPPVEEHYAILQSMVDVFYKDFRDLVAERRPQIDAAQMDMVADGRVFTGARALELGLVDEVGGIREAFEAAKSLAKIEYAQLVKYHTEGRRPNSPYALGPALQDRLGASPENEINLIQFKMGPGQGSMSGFYYLWSPGSITP